MGRTVLVVDDEPDLAELLRLMLKGAGYRVAVARDGRAALRMLGEARHDLVLCDVLMPVMDGPGLAAAMQAAEFGDVPEPFHRDDLRGDAA